MLSFLTIFPFPFWLVMGLLVGGGYFSVKRFRDGSGLPMLAVLGTVAVWYVGDAWYNDYAENHATLFEPTILSSAWLQVAWFLLVFLVSVPWLHRRINGKDVRRGSGVQQLFKHGINQPFFQGQLVRLFYGCLWVWVFLAAIAVLRLQDQVVYFFFPFLGYKASPWSHGRLGAGFDFLAVVALYLQLLVAGMFGVVAALSTHRKILWLALVCCLLSWPYFIFDRTRNTMLALVIPGALSWVFLRLRGSVLKKLVVLSACFLLVNGWMAFVIANRTESTIIGALKEKGFGLRSTEKVRHEGLNMYEELCWISAFNERGTYKPNWGRRYFAELVNPIPRRFWPNKPLIGIDYAVARGQGGGEAGDAGVYATISTGLIGQGVVNFGPIVGPVFAALLMSFWAVILARLDLHIQEFGRLPLYSLGLILTFNLGRDITLITLYPFVFGAIAVWWHDRKYRVSAGQTQRVSRPVVGAVPSTVSRSSSPRMISRRPTMFFRRRVRWHARRRPQPLQRLSPR